MRSLSTYVTLSRDPKLIQYLYEFDLASRAADSSTNYIISIDMCRTKNPEGRGFHLDVRTRQDTSPFVFSSN